MTCYRPVQLRTDRNSPIPAAGPVGSSLVRCGRCVGCRIDRARDWSLRCRDESMMHEHSLFLTLTYDEKHVPYTLVPADLSGFVKRLRGRLGSFRFFGCGEYGDRFGRPHYHALLFGASVSRDERASGETYRSHDIAAAWTDGQHIVGEVTPASAAYVAGYVGKKFGRVDRSESRVYYDPESGELVDWQQPFARMSNRPGIGVPYLEKYGTELLRGFAIRDGRKVPLPRYYREWLAERFPDRMAELKRNSVRLALAADFEESHPRRMVAREEFADLRRQFFHPE